MPERIALKMLSPSDLTFFDWHFQNAKKGGNQKSINLNRDVFIDELYPAAPAISPTTDDQITVALTLFGPGLKGAYPKARKIIKGEGYKNWRLNGEAVPNPDDDPERFNVLTPGDLALIDFKGELIPTAASIVFISAHVPEDAPLHEQLRRLVPGGRKSMVRVNRASLNSAAAAAGIPSGHPFESFLLDPEFDLALQDAAYGNEQAARTVRRRAGRRISAADLAKARQNASRVGQDGEGLVRLRLEERKAAGEIASVEWSSNENAVSPYDFLVATAAGEEIRIDAKSTEGDFSRDLHISAAEIAEAAAAPQRYDLYRVYGINADGAKLRIAEGVKGFAQAIVAGLGGLPGGVRPDSFSVDPAVLDWGPEIYIERPDEPDDEES